ncbi:MAG: response regulator [Labilithrix sp.]|nr:response regulator [Labilithrix sp.]MCW5813693.1 response regulator [Labilithrix sp.]
MTAPNEPLPSVNILVVDDEPSNLLALEAILEPLQQNVVRASSGVEALRLALKMEFCVVLLDVQMPEMDGLETAELLRKRPKTKGVPIIFLTAINKESSWVARGYGVGAVDYLFKPYDPDTLRTKVATFVDLAKKNIAIRAQHADFRRWSERRYEDLADSMPQVVWTADPDGTVKYRNKQWEQIAGGADEGFAAIVHPADLDAFEKGWADAVQTKKAWEAELRIGARYHLVRAVPRLDDHIAGWVGTATDIDDRVRADRALRMLADASQLLNRSLTEEGTARELEAALSCALPILGDAAILDVREGGERQRVCVTRAGVDERRFDDPRFDLGPSTVGYSGRAEVFLDVKAEAAELGKLRESERSPNPSGRGGEHLRFLAELGVDAYICVPLLSRERTIGTLSFVRVEGGGVFDGGDVDLAEDLARRIAVSIDNSRLHVTTERRREELELANKSKDLFLATLSHELRTPLNAIVGWTDMMRRGQLAGDELHHAMETIDRNALALSGLVADLLDVSRIVTGTLKIESKHVPIASIVDAAVAAARPQCATKEITLETSATSNATVMGDAGRLRQVIHNLLSNAVKFTPPGGKVSVRLEGDDASVRVVVADSGEGIDPAFLPHVFERFRQSETARTRGLGLGLAIVKHLVEEHRGTVHASSEGQGRGSTFTIELPVASDAPAAISEEHTVENTGEPDLKGVHVLIVEDDPDGNELICTILERYGAKVSSATTAAAALDVLSTEHPQILVSDIGLPDMDGIELIKTVRARPEIAEIPAVALTAYASRQDATKAIGAGFDAHVAKPVQPATLGGAVARLLTTTTKDPRAPKAASSAA